MSRTILACALIHSALCLAQPAAQPAFEVAAIKPSNTGDTSTSSHSGKGRITIDNLNLKELIERAYNVKAYQVAGGPKWAETDRYHIDAKADSGVKDDQLMPMVQTLLAERFKLVLHREQKTMPGYALVVAKGGLKIHPVTGEGSGTNANNSKLTATHVSMDRFAFWLARRLDLPVVDETGVKDSFSFVLEFANERQQKADAGDGASALPSLFTALPEQLGLKLESRKVPIEILVIDRAERPSDN